MNQVIIAVIIVILPMFCGFLIPYRSGKLRNYLERFLTLILYAILLLIGMNITNIKNLDQQWSRILLYGLSFLSLTLLANIAVAYVVDRLQSKRIYRLVKKKHSLNWQRRLQALYFSARQLLFIILGMSLGFFFADFLVYSSLLMSLLLMLMLFAVGMLLRQNKITPRQLFFNGRMARLALFFTLSCWTVALILAYIFALPAAQAVALNSGFGWYSLTVGYFQETYGTFWGAVAVINDLGREIMAFILIPLIMQFSPSSGFTLSGAVCLDFTLPAIQEVGGFAMVPDAISFGFMTSLICPLAIAFFSHL